ncbi:MAG: hypothetical protein AB7L28_21410, partial [Kofleriaceae bacterium]
RIDERIVALAWTEHQIGDEVARQVDGVPRPLWSTSTRLYCVAVEVGAVDDGAPEGVSLPTMQPPPNTTALTTIDRAMRFSMAEQSRSYPRIADIRPTS